MSSSKNFKNLVWLKKDLRVEDHGPLFKAVSTGDTMALFIIEENWLNGFECSDIHKQFLKDSLLALKIKLDELKIPFIVKTGNAVSVLSGLKNKYKFSHLYSHEETGLYWTYERDLRVKIWARENSVDWKESKQFAVLRGLKDRDKWNKKRSIIIERDMFLKPSVQHNILVDGFEFNLDSISDFKRNEFLQTGGSFSAVETLKSFYSGRGENYFKELSSPNTAYQACSRLSPYITWGNISLTQIHHSIIKKKNSLSMLSYSETKKWSSSLKAFESRLWWHCHFIQKLESEPEMEFQNVNRAFDGMRENDFNKEYFEAWKNGETGFPIIDACMKALKQNGWINFRMRAMLVSFASYQLWLHWEELSHFLAKYFIDFEPGIHFSQFQMQSGVTGINTIRMYSPVKQSLDQDPEGAFIKSYLTELEALDPKHLAEPWTLPPMLQKMMGFDFGSTYPRPIIDHKLAYKEARDKVYEWRQKATVKEEAKRVYQKHGSRKHKRFPDQHRKVF